MSRAREPAFGNGIHQRSAVRLIAAIQHEAPERQPLAEERPFSLAPKTRPYWHRADLMLQRRSCGGLTRILKQRNAGENTKVKIISGRWRGPSLRSPVAESGLNTVKRQAGGVPAASGRAQADKAGAVGAQAEIRGSRNILLRPSAAKGAPAPGMLWGRSPAPEGDASPLGQPRPALPFTGTRSNAEGEEGASAARRIPRSGGGCPSGSEGGA